LSLLRKRDQYQWAFVNIAVADKTAGWSSWSSPLTAILRKKPNLVALVLALEVPIKPQAKTIAINAIARSGKPLLFGF
jgi:hypothetical protein